MCNKHYRRFMRTGSTEISQDSVPEYCTHKGCTNNHFQGGFCTKHYWRNRRHGNTDVVLLVKQENPPEECLVEECGRKHRAAGLCERHYNIITRRNSSAQEYSLLLKEQKGRCALCDKKFEDTPHFDHDRGCCPGEKSCGDCNRGLLCRGCNMGLGAFGDSSSTLLSAAKYLQRWNK